MYKNARQFAVNHQVSFAIVLNKATFLEIPYNQQVAWNMGTPETAKAMMFDSERAANKKTRICL